MKRYPIWAERLPGNLYVVYWGSEPYQWTICTDRSHLVSVEF